jgi:hypothetical protein
MKTSNFTIMNLWILQNTAERSCRLLLNASMKHHSITCQKAIILVYYHFHRSSVQIRNLSFLVFSEYELQNHNISLTVHLEHLHVKMGQIKLSFTPPEECGHIFSWPDSGIRGCNRRDNTHSLSDSFILCLFNDTVGSSKCTALNGRMICKQWIGKDMEGSSHSLVWGTIPSFT